MADYDDQKTPVTCDACDGDPDRRVGCRVCLGLGFISFEARKLRTNERIRRISSAHLEFSANAKKVIAKLQERAKEQAAVHAVHEAMKALELVTAGREITRELDSWIVVMPDDEVRTKTITDLMTWSRKAHEFLTKRA